MVRYLREGEATARGSYSRRSKIRTVGDIVALMAPAVARIE
jgi:hypothetical protein